MAKGSSSSSRSRYSGFFSFLDSPYTHSRVEIVKVGTRSPMTGRNSTMLRSVERLLLVIAKRMPVTMASGMSPMTGRAKRGAAT